MPGLFKPKNNDKKAAPKSGGLFTAHQKDVQKVNKNVATTKFNMNEQRLNSQTPATPKPVVTKPDPLMAKSNKFTHPAEVDQPVMSMPKKVTQGDPQKLGLASPLENPFAPKPSSKPGANLLRSNPSVRAYEPKKADRLSAGLKQLNQGMQSAVAFQQQPTSEVPSTGNKTIDSLLRETGSFLPGLMSGQTESEALGGISKGAQYLGAKLLPKAPIVNKIASHALEAGVENARVGAAAGQTDPSQLRDNFLYGGAFGAGGSALSEGGRAIGRYVRKIAQETTASNPVYNSIVHEIGETGAKAEIGKRNLADIDEQIGALSKSNVPDKNAQLQTLFNERKGVVDYIKQHEPDFEAPKPRVRASVGKGDVVVPQAPPEPVTPASEVKQGIEQISPAVAEKPVVKPAPVETPKPAPQPAKKIEQQKGTYSNTANQLENGNYSEETKKRIQESNNTYDVAHNVDTVERVNEVIKNIDQARTKFFSNELLHSGKNADHTVLGYRLMDEYDAQGKYDDALEVSKKLREDLKNQGQGNQAASVLSRLSPEGQLMSLVRKAEANGMEVTPKDSADFTENAKKSKRSKGAGKRDIVYNNVIDKLKKGEEPTPEDIKNIDKYLSDAQKSVEDAQKPKTPKATKPKVKTPNIEDTVPELKEPKKREKVISFFDAQEKAALARIAARKNRLNSVPVDEMADHAIVVASQLAKGSIHAATYIEDLVKEYGEEAARLVSAQAEKLVKKVAKKSAEDKLDEAIRAFDEVTGRAAKEKAVVEEMAAHVKEVIEQAKKGEINADDIQKMRDYSDEIAKMLEGKPTREVSAEKRYLQNVKSLAKKIAEVESNKLPTDQANKEISSLIRKVANDPAVPKEKRVKMDMNTDNALNNIASDVMKRTRPTPKPTTLQEKIVEQFLKKSAKEGRVIPESSISKMRQLAKDVTQLEEMEGIKADIEMQRIMNSYVKSSVNDKVDALRYLAMLGNTHTQLLNAASGPIMAGYEGTLNLFGAMAESVLKPVLKNPRTTTTYGISPLKWMADWVKYAKIGAKAGWHGVDPSGIHNANEVRGIAWKGKNPVSRVIGTLERSLGAVAKGADFGAYKAVYNSELRKQGYLAAKREGVKGKDAIDQYVNKFMKEPPPEAMDIADRQGKNVTFQREDRAGGAASNWINSAHPKLKPFVKAVVPFARTPLNIAETAFDMTPAGIFHGMYSIIRAKTAAEQRDAVRRLGLGVTGGVGLSSLGYYLSSIGVITGANDSGDPNLDSLREQAGKGKYRFNTSGLIRYIGAMLNGEGSKAAEDAAKYREGDKQFDYNKLQPLALPLALGAGLENNKKKGVLGSVSSAASEAAGSLYGMSAVQGIAQVTNKPQGSTLGEQGLGLLSNIAESYLKSFSPSILGQEARREDPTQRKTAYAKGIIPDVKEYYMSRTPGLSQMLPAKKETLGQTRQNPAGITGNYLNPYKSEKAPFNKAAQIVSDLVDRTGLETLAPTPPEKKVSGKSELSGDQVSIPIPAKRYAQLQEEIGNEVTKQILALPESMSDNDKADKIEKIYTDVRKKYMDIVKKELGIRVKK